MFMYVLYFCPSISVFLLAFMRVSFAFRVLSSKQMSLGKSGWVFAIITLPALQSKVRNWWSDFHRFPVSFVSMCCFFRNCHQDPLGHLRTQKIADSKLNLPKRCPTSNVSHLRVCDLTDLTGPSGPWIIENMVLKKNQIHGEQKHRKTYKNHQKH